MADTIAAIATTSGGAIGIIRISGDEAITITNHIFRPQKQKDFLHVSGYSVHYGQIYDPENTNVTVDEALVIVFRNPHSYTGEDSVEISLHGSPYIMQRTMELLILSGARQAAPGEFTQRAFLNGKMDLSQAEAVADLIAVENATTHRMAMQQLKGGISTELGKLRNELLKLTSLLELELDFSDQDVKFADRTQLIELTETTLSHIHHLAETFHTGNALKNGIPIAIIGAPNVGKSTLLNKLLNEEKAIVSEEEGTTRDLIEDTIHIHGICYRFIDTAGIRNTRSKVEKIGIQRSMQAAEKSRFILLLTEQGIPFPSIPLPHDVQVIRVINKCDKNNNNYNHNNLHNSECVCISALTGEGIPELLSHIEQATQLPHTEKGEIIITHLRHYQALMESIIGLKRVKEGLHSGLQNELIIEDLKLVLEQLGKITGSTIQTEEILQSIFHNFCIGK